MQLNRADELPLDGARDSVDTSRLKKKRKLLFFSLVLAGGAGIAILVVRAIFPPSYNEVDYEKVLSTYCNTNKDWGKIEELTVPSVSVRFPQDVDGVISFFRHGARSLCGDKGPCWTGYDNRGFSCDQKEVMFQNAAKESHFSKQTEGNYLLSRLDSS